MLTWILVTWRVAGTPPRARRRLVPLERASVRRVGPEDRPHGREFRRGPWVSRPPLPTPASSRVPTPSTGSLTSPSSPPPLLATCFACLSHSASLVPLPSSARLQRHPSWAALEPAIACRLPCLVPTHSFLLTFDSSLSLTTCSRQQQPPRQGGPRGEERRGEEWRGEEMRGEKR